MSTSNTLTSKFVIPDPAGNTCNGRGNNIVQQEAAHGNNNPNNKSNNNDGNATNKPVYTMIAGCLAGVSGTIVGYPLDSLKVWVQTNTMGKNKHLGTNTNSNSNSNSTMANKKGLKAVPSTDKKSSSSTRSNTKKRDVGIKSTSSKGLGARRSNSTTAVTSFPATTHKMLVQQHHQRATGAAPSTAATAARIVGNTNPTSTIARTVRALYSGVSGPLVTVGMVQSMNFGAYDATRRFLYRRQQQQQQQQDGSSVGIDRDYRTQDSLKNVAMSGSVGGMTTAILTAPLLMMKINQQISGNSFRKAFRQVFVVEDGQKRLRFQPLRPYGAAFLPHLLSESVGRAIYVTSYEGLKRSLLASKRKLTGVGVDSNADDRSTDSLLLSERMACAAMSGILCWGTFFPLDALRNRMYHAASRQQPRAMTTNTNSNVNVNKPRALSVLETIRVIRKEKAFYRGFSISILRAGPVAAAVLPVYDLTLEKLSSLE